MTEARLERFAAGPEEVGQRLDVAVSRLAGETRSCVQRLLLEGNVLVNGRPAKANQKLKAGDEVEISFPAPAASPLEPMNIPLSIVYEDADIAVIDKPKGMVVHPAPGHPDGTLVNAVLYQIRNLSGVGGELRPGIVHRIDKMTSGLLVIAKNDVVHRALAEQMKQHRVARTYLALVEGNLREEQGTVDAPIGRHPTDRKRMAVVREGRSAVTHWRALARFGAYTLVEANLETGRTHQIRVHMAYLKHPVAGDTVYGPEKPKLGLCGQALHARVLELVHPRTGERMRFVSPVPEYFLAALRKAGWDGEQFW